MGPWGHCLDRQHPQVWTQGVYGQDPHADPEQIPVGVNTEHVNNAKHHYDMVHNVDPNIETVITQDVEMTSDINHSDLAFACNTWMEFTYPEMTITVSNPWVQIWKGGIRPLYDTRNDLDTFAGVAAKLSDMTGDTRMKDYFKFVFENRVDVYAQRILDASSTFYGYSADVMLKSEKGWMVMTRTYPRLAFWEETNESKPMWTRTGRYRKLPDRAGGDRIRRKLHLAPRGHGSDPLSAECHHDHQPLCPPRRLRDSDYGAAP